MEQWIGSVHSKMAWRTRFFLIWRLSRFGKELFMYIYSTNKYWVLLWHSIITERQPEQNTIVFSIIPELQLLSVTAGASVSPAPSQPGDGQIYTVIMRMNHTDIICVSRAHTCVSVSLRCCRSVRSLSIFLSRWLFVFCRRLCSTSSCATARCIAERRPWTAESVSTSSTDWAFGSSSFSY